MSPDEAKGKREHYQKRRLGRSGADPENGWDFSCRRKQNYPGYDISADKACFLCRLVLQKRYRNTGRYGFDALYRSDRRCKAVAAYKRTDIAYQTSLRLGKCGRNHQQRRALRILQRWKGLSDIFRRFGKQLYICRGTPCCR